MTKKELMELYNSHFFTTTIPGSPVEKRVCEALDWDYLGTNQDKLVFLREYCGCLEFLEIYSDRNERR